MYYNGSPDYNANKNNSTNMPNTKNWDKYAKNINSDRGYDGDGYPNMQNSSKHNTDRNSSYDNMSPNNYNKNPNLNNNNYQSKNPNHPNNQNR